MQVVLYTVSIPKILTVNNIWLFFLLSLHFKDNTVCVIEHISFNNVVQMKHNIRGSLIEDYFHVAKKHTQLTCLVSLKSHYIVV